MNITTNPPPRFAHPRETNTPQLRDDPGFLASRPRFDAPLAENDFLVFNPRPDLSLQNERAEK